MVIYSFYYYKNFKYLGGGYVADADTTQRINVIPHPYLPETNKSISYDGGLVYALVQANIPFMAGGQSNFKSIMDERTIINFIGKYNQKNTEKIDSLLFGKFRKHPPLQFTKLKENDNFIFSYLFKNISLEAPDYQINNRNYDFDGKSVKFINYSPSKYQNGHLYQSSDSTEKLFNIHTADSTTIVSWYQYPKGGASDIVSLYKRSQTIRKNKEIGLVYDKDEVLVPEIDLFLVKTYTPEAAQKYFNNSFSDYQKIEARVKIKTTAPTNQEPAFDNGKKKYIFSAPCLFTITKKGEKFPYYALLLNNAEVLKK
jgi:hypothetical protein